MPRDLRGSEWRGEQTYTNDFTTSLQNDLSYLLSSMTQEIYQALFLAEKKKYRCIICKYTDHKIHVYFRNVKNVYLRATKYDFPIKNDWEEACGNTAE